MEGVYSNEVPLKRGFTNAHTHTHTNTHTKLLLVSICIVCSDEMCTFKRRQQTVCRNTLTT